MIDDIRPVVRERAPRRDAQRRREALLTAAAECFMTHGYAVPLETIAGRAGVGRGTLYRNFRDREALALAIFSREIDRMEALLDPAAPFAQTIATLVRGGANASSLFTRIAVELHVRNASLASFQVLRERLERMVTPLVVQAWQRRELHPAVSPADVVLAMRMAGALLLPFKSEQEVTTQINAALHLLLEGLRPR